MGSGRTVLRFDVVTLFPPMFEALTQHGITRRALELGLYELRLWNPRDFTTDNHKTVDDRPYGGGPGMVMMAEPLEKAMNAARERQRAFFGERQRALFDERQRVFFDEHQRAATLASGERTAAVPEARVIYLSPQGKKLTHEIVARLVGEAGLILLAGRYEGIDERLIERQVDEEISIGDYVLSGGELPAMVLIDAIVRQLPGALNDADSAGCDSFAAGLLDHPHYTRPEVYEGASVPQVLLSGHHAQIERWRRKQALARTRQRRPELLQRMQLSASDTKLLAELDQESVSQSDSGKAKE
jgi:tRNA (guanine37-N1)-methyltransferase